MITPVTQYRCSDGQMYGTQAEAQTHENLLNSVIVFETDYYENGTQKKGYILVHCFAKHSEFAEEWCFQTFGNQYKFKDSMYSNDKMYTNWSVKRISTKVTQLPENAVILAKIEEALISKIF